MDSKPKIDACIGMPVVFDAAYEGISDSRGIGRWKSIVIGRSFFAFAPREQQAILLHEVGHCKLKHLEKRLRSFWLLLIRPSALKRLCVEQEYEADRFVRACGYGADLASAFARIRSLPDPLHPPVEERIARLLQAG